MNCCLRSVCISCLVIVTAVAQINSELHVPVNRTGAKLKGNVHTVKIEQRIITRLDERVIEDLRFTLEEVVFDPQGLMIEFKDYPSRGILRRWTRYEYRGQILQRSTSEFYDKEGKLYRKSEYDYDDTVVIKQQINFDYDDSGKMFRRTVLIREAPDVAVDIKQYKADGKLIKRDFLGNHFTQSGRPSKKEPSMTTPSQEPKKVLSVKERTTYDEVDTLGNWTKKTSPVDIRISNGQRLDIQESFIRTLTYY